MYAYSGILTALLRASATGQGAVLDVSMFEALGEWMSAPAYYTAYGGPAPPRSGRASCVDRAVRTVPDAR